MDKLELIPKNSPLLRKKTDPVETYAIGRAIADQLLDRLAMDPHGVGLAANQVGIDARVAVIKASPRAEPIILINSLLLDKSDHIYLMEGCLSLPGVKCKVKRYRSLRYSNWNANDEEVILTILPSTDDIQTLEACAVQHEIDHLNGTLISDRHEPSTLEPAFNLFGKKPLVAGKRPGRNTKCSHGIKYKYPCGNCGR